MMVEVSPTRTFITKQWSRISPYLKQAEGDLRQALVLVKKDLEVQPSDPILLELQRILSRAVGDTFE